jgi:hypothetical protein
LEHKSILLITTNTGTSNVLAYEKCSRVVSTTLDGASTHSMAKSAACAARPNKVVFIYFV